MTFLEM